MTKTPWRVRVMPSARRQLDRLPLSVAAAIAETLPTIAGNPRRLGKPLNDEFEGCWAARRGPYRIVYRLEEDTRTVIVLVVAHRSDAYRSR